MKTNIRPLLVGLLALSASLLAPGCSSKPADTATRLSVSNPMGKSVEVVLPKNFKATDLDLSVDPSTGTYHLKATKLDADASTVLEAAGAAQAQALAQLSGTISQILPLLTPLARPPAAPPASP
jgi:hypothetical protein